jgi:hypothetical protein
MSKRSATDIRLFVRKLLYFMFVQGCIWIAVLALYIKHETTNPHGFGRGYTAAAIDKHNRLVQQAHPRIVFVGGSNLAFGLDSAAIERSLPYKTVNMGLNLSLGLDFMLREIEPFLVPGDIVVISPEYEQFIDAYPGNVNALFTQAVYHPQSIRFFSYKHLAVLLDQGFLVIGGITRAAMRFAAEGVSTEDPSNINNLNNPYIRSAFNEYGDITWHHDMERKKIKIRPFGQSSPESITRVIDRLNQFSDDCRTAGVAVFYSYPPIFLGQLQAYQAMIQDIASNLTNRLHFPILDTPEEMSFTTEYIFDHEYHLTLQGKRIRTNHIITTLGKTLGHSSSSHEDGLREE